MKYLYQISSIMMIDNDLRLEAATLILAQNIPDQHLFCYLIDVIKYNPSLREEAWMKLDKVQLSNTQLDSVAINGPELASKARAKLVTTPRDASIVITEIQSIANSVRFGR